EMPGLCPLVLSLTGHSVDKSGSQVPLARALFGPGRSVFRGGSGSSIRSQGGSNAGVETARPGGTKAPAGRPAGGSSAPNRKAAAGAPVSTARTTAAATAPIPVKAEPPATTDDELAEEIGTGVA